MIGNCKDGDVIHAGAFFGDMIPGLSRAIGVGKSLWVFEPVKLYHRCSEVTVQLNSLSNVKLLNAALGCEAGVVAVQTKNLKGRLLAGRSRVVSRVPRANMAESVEQVSIDQVMNVAGRPRVSLIHLDLEGFEPCALRGAEHTIRRDQPTIVVETIPEDEWFEKVIRNELGYRQVVKLDGNHVLKISQ